MTKLTEQPSNQIASKVVKSMTGEEVISISRMLTGDQNFVFAVTTADSEYVIRMTDEGHKQKFQAAIYWQKMLIPLGVPLAEFIQTDLEGKYSPFPALLMKRLLGNDLVNVYSDLTDAEKKSLASEIIKIQALVTALPEGPGFGITNSYEHAHEFKTWYEFLMQRLHFFQEKVKNNKVFDPEKVSKVIAIAKNIADDLKAIPATPFLWDASERNVLIHDGKITGIVDVDELCFGDPLFVIALTSTALELEKKDNVYTDYWTELLSLDQKALMRLAFYKLFYAAAFMRKHSIQTTNSKKVMFDTELLNNIFQQALKRMDG
ncbi:MAG: aminoglycoside phosphotransferase family protein [Proteobacteria bacterium]|nr:aminoglycoside phosphotransferase family protein [Pseudomonadota bacterium]